jgi:hypothetical protein
MNEKKAPLKSKTVWLGIVVSVLAVLEYASGILSSFLSPEHAAIAATVVGALIIVLRALTDGPLKPPKVPGVGVLWALALVLALGATGCGTFTASERAAWGSFGKQTGSDLIVYTAKKGCEAAGLMCKQRGPAWCKTLVDLGCSFGRAKLAGALGKWQAGVGSPDPALVYAETSIAFATVPDLIRYEAKMRPVSDLAPAGACSVKPKIGFKVPTTAEGGSGVTDSAPLGETSETKLRETAGGK